jgi:opacity protein-like surface antigen
MKVGIIAVVFSLGVLGSNAFTDEDGDRGLPVTLGDPAGERLALAESFQDAPRERDEVTGAFTLGPVAGFIKSRDADKGTWFGGIQARYRFMGFLAVEGSITFHQSEYLDGDVTVTQYPVQVSALIFPLALGAFEPYAVIGAGWYYTRVDIDTPLVQDEDTDNLFGVHLGAGAQVAISPRFAVFADFRWIFIDEPATDNSNLDDEEFDAGQVTLGGSLRF